MTELTRREHILAAAIEYFKDDGHQLAVHEGETYARLVAKAGSCTIILLEINLDTLASQIDRRLK
ncbi:hypothetical protein D4A92_19835 [Rhizobium rosettiformans]|uniref:Uncharacterized protein n=1 Tax=Rhizobium rosettiformans TaxID=1368430 RepID=A0ABX7F1Y2_9HYPH|nr:hypothetical protein [Rhizobium rosettiformans]QRF53538.1 hypothetical protein D4A92_19835 [Rhizobium rosettiformans]